MASRIQRPHDLPRTRRFDGRTYSFRTYEHGAGAKRSVQNYGKKLRKNGAISHYRVVKYRSVKVRTSPHGNHQPRTVYALYVR